MKKLFLLLVASALSAADVTINSLPAISTVTSSTVLPVVDVAGTPTTKKATVSQLMTGLPAATSTTVGTMSAADKLKLDNATNANTASAIVQRDASGNFSAGTVTAAVVTGLAPPSAGTDAANKTYVDAAAAGLIIHTPARAATVGSNITLSGGAPNTLDGVTLFANYRILVKDQTDNKENGIYYVATLGTGVNGTWTRTTDADTGAELPTGSYIFIMGGTVNVNAAYTMTTPGTITIGSSAIVWNLFSQVTQIQAANILGQIVASQVQDAAINTAKFAAGLRPVELLGTLPTTGNTAGRMVFLTSDSKLYRYNGTAFTAMVPTNDLEGTITSVQITDNAITAPKLLAGAVTAGKIAANAVTAGTIAANAVTAGTIQAGAVNTTELAANAITSDKIYANAVTADKIVTNAITAPKILAGAITTDKIAALAITSDKISVGDLSTISPTLGTITGGTITANTQISVGAGMGAISLSSVGLTIAAGRISMVGDGVNPWIRVTGVGSYSGDRIEINGQASPFAPFFSAMQGGVGSVIITPSGGLTMANSKPLMLSAGSTIEGPGNIDMNADSSTKINISAGETGAVGTQIGYWQAWLNGRRVLIPIYNAP